MPMFRVRSYKRVNGASNRENWSNTYHIWVDEAADGARNAYVGAAAMAIVNWERTFHLQSTIFERVVVSTVTKGDTGPDALKAYPVGQAGLLQNISEDPLPLEYGVVVGFESGGGRVARMHYRNAVAGQDWSTVAGQPAYGYGQHAANIEGLEAQLADPIPLHIPVKGDPQSNARPVTAVVVLGIHARDTNIRRKKKPVADNDGSILDSLMGSTDELITVSGLLASRLLKNAGYALPATITGAIAAIYGAVQLLEDSTKVPMLPEG